MPQILNLSTRTMGTVALRSPGAAQQAICTPVVYLEATISGDPAGHSFEWVQLTGTPTVTLYVVSNTQAYYLPGSNPGSDKIFRYYIDKGTGIEQFGDVTIYATPTSTGHYVENGGADGVATDPSYAFVQSYRSILLSVFNSTIPFNSVGTVISGTAVLSYALPELYYQTSDSNTQSFAARFVNTKVDKWDGTGWSNVLTAAYSQPREVTLNEGDRIRIGATYRTPNGYKTDYSQWYDFSASAVSGNTVMNTVENGGAQGVTTIVRTVFRIVTQIYSENLTTHENGGAVGATAITRIVYVLSQQSYDENLTTVENGGATGKYSITRVTGGTIGG